MATAEQLVAKKIRDMTISVKDFLTSSALTAYLQSMLSVPCRAIRRAVPKCKITYDSKSRSLACTNDKIIVINAGHPFIASCRTRTSKVKALIGLEVHEYGHYRFTDFAGMMNAQAKLKVGKFYPKITDPSTLPTELAANHSNFTEFFLNNPLLKEKILEEWHHIWNILEDAYIEECLYRTISGVLIDGLDFVRRKTKKTAHTVAEMLDRIAEDEENLLPCMHSLLLSYAKFGAVRCNYKNVEERSSEPMQLLRKCQPYVDALLFESITEKRLNGVNMVFLTLWPVIRKSLESIDIREMTEDEYRDLMKKFSGSMESEAASGEGSGTSVGGDEDTGKSGSASTRKKTILVLKKTAPTTDESEESASGDSEGVDSEEEKEPSGKKGERAEDDEASDPESSGSSEEDPTSGESSEDDSEKEGDSRGKKGCSENDEVSDKTSAPEGGGEADDSSTPADSATPSSDAPARDLSSGTPRPTTPDLDTSGEDGEVFEPEDGFFETEEDEDGSYDERELIDSLTRVEREIREESAIRAADEELTASLRKEVRDTDFGAAHRGVPVTLHRISKVDDITKDIYRRSTSAIEDIADMMVRKILPHIKKDAGSDLPLSGYFSGGKFDATRLVSNDWRYFRQNAAPAPDTRLAVTVLVDESGSMSLGDEDGTAVSRISAARNAALALYLFCQKAGIKCAVMGHSADQGCSNSVELYSYADFEAADRDDKYRLMNISARSNNRDGAATLFAGEHLLKREEPTKLMIVISDGAPLANGYYGMAAETDLSNIVNELRRKGVIIFAAAIGSDKENIQRIYDSGFVDISNLSTLPDQLLQLVRRYIR